MSDRPADRSDMPIVTPRVPVEHPPAKPPNWEDRQGKPRITPLVPPKPPLENK